MFFLSQLPAPPPRILFVDPCAQDAFFIPSPPPASRQLQEGVCAPAWTVRGTQAPCCSWGMSGRGAPLWVSCWGKKEAPSLLFLEGASLGKCPVAPPTRSSLWGTKGTQQGPNGGSRESCSSDSPHPGVPTGKEGHAYLLAPPRCWRPWSVVPQGSL